MGPFKKMYTKLFPFLLNFKISHIKLEQHNDFFITTWNMLHLLPSASWVPVLFKNTLWAFVLCDKVTE